MMKNRSPSGRAKVLTIDRRRRWRASLPAEPLQVARGDKNEVEGGAAKKDAKHEQRSGDSSLGDVPA